MPAARLRPLALRAARLAERGADRVASRPGAAPVLDPYLGYATPDGLVLRGRVLTRLRRTAPDPENSRWTNLRQMAQLFLTDEVAGVAVEAGGARALSDAEGYVTLDVPGTFPAGWTTIRGRIAGAAEEVAFHARVPGADARWMVISDIDDTVIETGAHSLARNLWTTFTGSALTRRAHRDAADLLEALAEEGRNPVFYVSSSPWNLHAFLERLFDRAAIPRGPMFLRDLGITDEGIGASHGTHKGGAIDAIMAANPGLDAWLVGDSGQADARVYLDAVRRHPGRVRGVALREPTEGAGRDDAACMAAIEAEGVPCFHAHSLDGARGAWGVS
jgi:phosphatidate phosphatase APP1